MPRWCPLCFFLSRHAARLWRRQQASQRPRQCAGSGRLVVHVVGERMQRVHGGSGDGVFSLVVHLFPLDLVQVTYGREANATLHVSDGSHRGRGQTRTFAWNRQPPWQAVVTTWSNGCGASCMYPRARLFVRVAQRAAAEQLAHSAPASAARTQACSGHPPR